MVTEGQEDIMTAVDQLACDLNEQIIQLSVCDREKKLGHAITRLQKYARNPIKGANLAYQRYAEAKFDGANDIFLTWNNDVDTCERIAVYTCITGAYDNLKNPSIVPSNIDYYVVSDSETQVAGPWRCIPLDSVEGIEGLDRVRSARFVKTHPHLLFPNYRFSIWVDANILIVGNLSKYLHCTGKGVPFASHWHPRRNCIYDEGEVCKLYKRDDSDLITRQLSHYRKKGMPAHYGLVETNMIVREHNDERCMRLMESWWGEIECWSRRDQLSLTYAAWSQGLTIHDFGFIADNITANSSVRVLLHSDT